MIIRTVSVASQNVTRRRSLGRSGGRCRRGVVGDEVDLGLSLMSFLHDFGRVLNHLRIQYARQRFLERGTPAGEEQGDPFFWPYAFRLNE